MRNILQLGSKGDKKAFTRFKKHTHTCILRNTRKLRQVNQSNFQLFLKKDEKSKHKFAFFLFILNNMYRKFQFNYTELYSFSRL